MLGFRSLLSWMGSDASRRQVSGYGRVAVQMEATERVLLCGALALAACQLVQAGQSVAADPNAEAAREAKLAFERGQPLRATVLFDRYLAGRPADSRALLAAGEIDLACFRDQLAQERLSRALQLSPGETRALRVCARVAGTPAEEIRLLAKYVTEGVRSKSENQSELEDALSHIRLHELIGNEEAWRLSSQEREHRIPLRSLVSGGGRRIGLGLPVSINGGKPLALLLDSGADNILISEKRAKSLGLKYYSEGRIVGAGGRETTATRLAIAETVTIGGVEFHEAIVQVSRHEATADQDGLIGLPVFAQFLIGLDLRRGKQELTLEPLPVERAPVEKQTIDVVRLKHLLLVKTALDRRMEGYFIFDTGSAYSAIDSKWAERIPAAHLMERPMEMKSATGFLTVNRWRMGLGGLEVGGQPLPAADVISLDLSRFSNNHGFRVAGLIGLSSLAGSLVKVNYRDGAVDFEQ